MWNLLTELEPNESLSVIAAMDLGTISKDEPSRARMGFDMNVGNWVFAQIHHCKKSNVDYAIMQGYSHYCPMLTPPGA